jgi:hypothetical protein
MIFYPPLLDLDPYQVTGSLWLASKAQALCADFMGIGKSAEAVRACDLIFARKILVISPGNARVNWQREFQRFSPMDRSCCAVMPGTKVLPEADILILSYEMATTMADELKRRHYDVLILDEAHYCFPYTVEVQTISGPKAIGSICETDRDEYVLCCDLATDSLEYKRVTGRVKTPLYTDLVEVIHEHGKFVCTADHEVWTTRGYVPAARITKTDSVRVVQKFVFCAELQIQHQEILHSEMRGPLEDESSRSGGGRGETDACISTSDVRDQMAVFRQEDAREQSDEGPENQAKNGRRFEWAAIPDGARREREIFYAPKAPGRSDWLRDGASRENREGADSLQQDSNILRLGSGLPREESGGGDRWALPQHVADTRSGQKERRGFVSSRVVGVTIQKRGSDGESAASRGTDTFVYCIEVEEHQNFFANGVLVSNCKERSAKRTKAIYGVRSNAPGIIASAARCWRLTGTPAPSHAGELYTHFRSAGLATEPYYDWLFRYCSGFNSDYGFKVTGHKNEAELRARLEPFMLRRMEGTELPPLCFETVAVERSDELLKPFLNTEGAAIAAGDEELRRALAKPGDNALKILESTAASYSTLRRFTVLAKLPAIAEILEQNFEAGMDKMVLFAVHVDAVEWLAEKLKKFNPVLLYGKTPANKKQVVVDAFQNNERCKLLIGNIQAAGIAITLTAGCEVGFAEKVWVPGDIVQALKRCHRRGQTRPVRVRSFTLYDSSDEAVDEALMRKVKELAKIL